MPNQIHLAYAKVFSLRTIIFALSTFFPWKESAIHIYASFITCKVIFQSWSKITNFFTFEPLFTLEPSDQNSGHLVQEYF